MGAQPGGVEVPKRLACFRALVARRISQAIGRAGRAACLSATALLLPHHTSAFPVGNPRLTTAPSPSPQPALWVVSDRDTIIYLFGTFHALDSQTLWFGKSIRAAFDASDELVLETIVPDNPADLHAALARSAMASAPVVGAPVVAPSRPGSFAAQSRDAMAAGRSVGMSVDKGADAVLKRAATQAGKSVDGLERFEDQLTMYRGLPGSAAPSSAGADAQPAPQQVAQILLQMKSAWQRGDHSRFVSMLAGIEAQSPVTYRRLFADRNANWASWIAERMERPGIVFVAVGTGHLIGRDSVQNMLAAKGINAARIS